MPKIQNVPKWMQRDLLPPGTDPTAFFGVAPKQTVPSLPIPKVATPPVATAPVAPVATAPTIPVTPPPAPMAGTEAWFTQQFRTTTDPAAMAALRQLYKETRQPFNPATATAAAPPVPTVPTGATRAAAPLAAKRDNLLTQLQQTQAQPFDPATSPFTGPLQAMAQQGADLASQRAMEIMNQRGILNSTITSDRVAQIQQQAMVEVLPQILEAAYGIRRDEIGDLFQMMGVFSGLEQQTFERQRGLEQEAYVRQVSAEAQAIAEKERQYKQAMDRLNFEDTVDNATAAVLGVKPGIPTPQAKQTAQARALELEKLRIQSENRIKEIATEQSFRAQESERDRAYKAAVENLKNADKTDELARAQAAEEATKATMQRYSVDEWTASAIVNIEQLPPEARWNQAQAIIALYESRAFGDDLPYLNVQKLTEIFQPKAQTAPTSQTQSDRGFLGGFTYTPLTEKPIGEILTEASKPIPLDEPINTFFRDLFTPKPMTDEELKRRSADAGFRTTPRRSKEGK